MSDKSTLPPDAVVAMIAHMNEDHADAVVGYVRRLAARPEARSARLVAIEPTFMSIDATIGEAIERVEIAFDHTLRDAGDARDTLIALARPPLA